MIQREIKDRLVAKRGSKNYSKITVNMQYHFHIKNLISVSPESFQPPPKVYSSFVKLFSRKNIYYLKDINNFKKIVNLMFNKRRKSIKNSLKSIIKKRSMEELRVDLEKRPEQIKISEYCDLSNEIKID